MNSVLKQFDLEREDLNFHCPRNIKDKVAGELISDSDWYFVGRTLKVSDKALNSIRDDHVNQSSPELKAVGALDAWDEEHGEKGATCLKLAEALHYHEKISVLETLCKEVNREKASESATTPETQRNQCKQGGKVEEYYCRYVQSEVLLRDQQHRCQTPANYCHVAVILLLEGSNLIKKCEELAR